MENDELGWPTFDFWWLLSLVLTRLRHGSLELLRRPENTSLELRESHGELQVILTRPETEPALGQGIISPLSEPLAALQESRSQEQSNLHEAHAGHFHINLTEHRHERQS